jgi:hypothetical protein
LAGALRIGHFLQQRLAHALRVIAEAGGIAKVAVTELPKM